MSWSRLYPPAQAQRALYPPVTTATRTLTQAPSLCVTNVQQAHMCPLTVPTAVCESAASAQQAPSLGVRTAFSSATSAEVAAKLLLSKRLLAQRLQTACVCPSGTYAKDGECLHLQMCLPGWGVRKQGSKLEDVRCRRCPRGTFSNVPSHALRCKTHTDCEALGMLLLLKGTDKTDNVCGSSSVGPIPSSSLRGKNLRNR